MSRNYTHNCSCHSTTTEKKNTVHLPYSAVKKATLSFCYLSNQEEEPKWKHKSKKIKCTEIKLNWAKPDDTRFFPTNCQCVNSSIVSDTKYSVEIIQFAFCHTSALSASMTHVTSVYWLCRGTRGDVKTSYVNYCVWTQKNTSANITSAAFLFLF